MKIAAITLLSLLTTLAQASDFLDYKWGTSIYEIAEDGNYELFENPEYADIKEIRAFDLKIPYTDYLDWEGHFSFNDEFKLTSGALIASDDVYGVYFGTFLKVKEVLSRKYGASKEILNSRASSGQLWQLLEWQTNRSTIKLEYIGGINGFIQIHYKDSNSDEDEIAEAMKIL